MNALPDIAKDDFIARFRAQLEANGVRVVEQVAAAYWYDRGCEPDFTPEEWAEAYLTYDREEA